MAFPVTRRLVKPFFDLFIKKVNGIENIPIGKPFIISPNQVSLIDTFLVLNIVFSRVKRMVHVFSTKRLWYMFGGALFCKHWVGLIPVERFDKGKRAIRLATRLLRKGKCVLIFPEGKVSDDGRMNRGKTGIARLVLNAEVPVIPVGIIGTRKILSKGKAIPRLRKEAIISFGKPMTFEKYYGKTVSYNLLRKLTDSIMKEIARLSSQDYDPNKF